MKKPADGRPRYREVIRVERLKKGWKHGAIFRKNFKLIFIFSTIFFCLQHYIWKQRYYNAHLGTENRFEIGWSIDEKIEFEKYTWISEGKM